MGAPIVYRWDDPGAPVFTAGPHGMRDVLLGCLVNGYGDKSAAGWSVVYDDWANGNFSLTNAAQSGILGLWHPLDSYAQYGPVVYSAEGMLSASAPVNGRSHSVVVTDTAALSYGGSDLHYAAYRLTSDGRDWVVVANENFAILIADMHSSGSSGKMSGNPQPWFETTYAPDMIFFGSVNTLWGGGSSAAPVLGNFVVCGGSRSHGGTYANNWHDEYIPSSFIRDTDGSVSVGARYSGFAPLRACDGPADSVYQVNIRPWLMYSGASSSSGTNLAGKVQYCTVPGLHSYCDVGRYLNQTDCDAFSPGVDAWEGVVDVAGTPFIYGTIGYSNNVFISLAASDW
tara:strand:+ start:1102 stop:2127 length:1026 start_codon:yes stop_codon:yes gene_type:complete